MTEQKINVGLYGVGTQRSRLREEDIYCDRCAECSFYKDNKCLNVTSLFSPRCPYGRIVKIDGGTKRAKSYTKVQESAKSDPMYAKLSYPFDRYIADFGDTVGIRLPWLQLTFENNILSIEPVGLSTAQWITIPKPQLTIEVLEKISRSKARTIFNESIKEHRTNNLPMFFRQLRELLPELYNKALKEIPGLAELQPNYVGKMAYLSTVNRDKTYHGFRFEGDYMVNDNYKSALLPFRAESSQLKIKLTNKMTVRITDNDQVLDTTRFV